MNFISLGNTCAPATMLRKYGVRQHAYPFDWCVTSLSTILDLMINGNKGFLDAPNLITCPPTERFLWENDDEDVKLTKDIVTPVVCTKYGILFAHDFDREGILKLNKVKTKYEKRFERLTKLIKTNEKICLVYGNDPINSWQYNNFNYANFVYTNNNIEEHLRILLDNLKLRYKESNITTIEYRNLEKYFKKIKRAFRILCQPKLLNI